MSGSRRQTAFVWVISVAAVGICAWLLAMGWVDRPDEFAGVADTEGQGESGEAASTSVPEGNAAGGEEVGRRLTVRVMDPSGKLLGEVPVEASWFERQGRKTLRSDAYGRVVFKGLPGEEVDIRAFAVGDFLATRPTRVIPEGQMIDLVLYRGAFVEGVVLSPDGVLLPGMAVEAEARQFASAVKYADEQGRFRIKAPSGQEVTLRVGGRQQQLRVGRAPAERSTPYRGELTGVTAPASGLVIRTRAVTTDR